MSGYVSEFQLIAQWALSHISLISINPTHEPPCKEV